MSTKWVLIVEDDTGLNDLYVRKMAAAGYQPVSAHSIQAALTYLTNEPPPLLVVLDLELPDGKGIDVLEYLAQSEQHQKTRTIVVSGHAFAKGSQEITRYTDNVLMKPVSPRQLVIMANHLMQQALLD